MSERHSDRVEWLLSAGRAAWTDGQPAGEPQRQAGQASGRMGSGGRPWVVLEKPKPPRVQDRYRYWSERPPALSARCQYWVRQIERGWMPNRRISREGYDNSSDWYGVFIWEYLNVLAPMVRERRRPCGETPAFIGCRLCGCRLTWTPQTGPICPMVGINHD